jgi:hypothetical protein
MLPKFLMADNFEVPDKVYIVHNQYPKCVIECSIEDFNTDQEIHWIDPVLTNDKQLVEFLNEAEKYYLHEFEELEEYDDDYEDDEEED